jgi:hypothetical protein
MTIEEARRKFIEDSARGPARCLCCKTLFRQYQRGMTSVIARALIGIYQVREDHGYAHMSHVARVVDLRGGDYAKARYWGLADPHPEKAGWWRLTSLGERFVKGLASVSGHALVVNGRCIDFGGEPVTIRQALGERFDYNELMGSAR